MLVEADALLGHCVLLARNLYSRFPKQYSAKLALSLDSHAVCLRALERTAEACTLKEEAVHLVTRLCEQEPSRYLPTLVELLRILAAYLCKAERFDDSRSAAETAVAHLKHLHAQDPSRYKPDYAAALCEYSTYPSPERSLSSHDNGNHALVAAAAESVALWQELCRVDPQKYEPALATSLYALGTSMIRSGEQLAEYTSVIAQAVALYRKLHNDNAELYSHPLAVASQCLHRCQLQGGKIEPVAHMEEAAERASLIAPNSLTPHNAPAPTNVPETMGPDEPAGSPGSWAAYWETFARMSPARRLPRGRVSEAVFRLLERWTTLPAQEFIPEQLEKAVLVPVGPFQNTTAPNSMIQVDGLSQQDREHNLPQPSRSFRYNSENYSYSNHDNDGPRTDAALSDEASPRPQGQSTMRGAGFTAKTERLRVSTTLSQLAVLGDLDDQPETSTAQKKQEMARLRATLAGERARHTAAPSEAAPSGRQDTQVTPKILFQNDFLGSSYSTSENYSHGAPQPLQERSSLPAFPVKLDKMYPPPGLPPSSPVLEARNILPRRDSESLHMSRIPSRREQGMDARAEDVERVSIERHPSVFVPFPDGYWQKMVSYADANPQAQSRMRRSAGTAVRVLEPVVGSLRAEPSAILMNPPQTPYALPSPRGRRLVSNIPTILVERPVSTTALLSLFLPMSNRELSGSPRKMPS